MSVKRSNSTSPSSTQQLYHPNSSTIAAIYVSSPTTFFSTSKKIAVKNRSTRLWQLKRTPTRLVRIRSSAARICVSLRSSLKKHSRVTKVAYCATFRGTSSRCNHRKMSATVSSPSSSSRRARRHQTWRMRGKITMLKASLPRQAVPH